MISYRALTNVVGEGRNEPNQSPFLPPPTGRLEFQLMNPLKFISDLVGPDFKMKILRYLVIIGCSALCVMCLPMIFSNLVAHAITSIF